MHLRRAIVLILCAIILKSIVIVNIVSAEDTIENLVEGVFEIEFESATNLKITIYMDVLKATAFGTVYDSDGVKNLATSTNENDIEARGVIKGNLHDTLKDQIEATFYKADIFPLNDKPTFEDDMFFEEYTVNLTSEYFNMNETINAYNFVNGVLDIGAIVNYSFEFQAGAGWNNTYLLDLGEKLDFKSTNGILQGENIKWILKNWNLENPDKLAKLQLIMKEPTSTSLEEDIFFEFGIDTKNVKKPSFSANLLIRSADITVFDIIPDFITNIKFVPSDGFRLFEKNGFITWDDCYHNIIKPLEEKTIATLKQSSFNQTLDFDFEWDNSTTTDCEIPYEISKMDDAPYLKAILKDSNVNLKICDISGRAFFGLINSGADASILREDVNFGDNLSNIGYNYSFSLFLPDNIQLDEKNVYTWDADDPISGEFKSENLISYDNEDRFTLIEIEVKNTDLNLLSFFAGKTEFTFGLYSRQTINYNVTTLPDQFIIPEKISLKYLNSDAFRLCVEEGVFEERRISDFLNNEKDLFKDRLKQVIKGLEVNTKVNREMFDDSISSWNGNTSNMDAELPVITNSFAHSTYSIPFDLSFIPPSINIPLKIFNFTKIPNQHVTYKIIFPKGISIDVSDPQNKSEIKYTKDGREYLLISFDASESEQISQLEVSCKMTPSGLFLIGIFSPCLISFFIAIVLIIIIILIRRKRKGRKEPSISDEEITGYEDEEYYVPPPPESK